MNDSEKLRETVETFCRFIEQLPTAALTDQAWGPKEVLAHLVFYHEGYVRQIEARLAGRPFDLPKGRYNDLNAQAAAAGRSVPVDELVRRLRAADERLRGLYVAYNPAQIMVEIKQGAKIWPLADLVPAVESHVRGHWQKLLIARAA
jgi:hypothetical protein